MEYLQNFYLVHRIFYFVLLGTNFSQQMTNSGSGSDLREGSPYFFYHHSEYPRDCSENLSQCSTANVSTPGVYWIKPEGCPDPFQVFCEGEWTVIQRRSEGSIDFNRNWVEYTEGFGFLNSEFWLGNERVSFLTNQKTYELQINMINEAGSSSYVNYNLFRISDDWGEFKLARLGEYVGNASSVTTECPNNMEYGSCSCQALCSAHNSCQKGCNDGEETCICPNGFLLDQDSNCVSEQECSCYYEGFGVIPDGDSYVTPDCSRRCSCINNHLNCVNFQCSMNATCQEIEGAGQCQCNARFEGDGLNCTRQTTRPTMGDCLDLYNAGFTADGVYTINPSNFSGSEFQIYCDMTTDDGGWTVFQRRMNGSIDFYQDWASYKVGFGSLRGEHWLGNDKIHAITALKDYQLRVNLVDSGNSSYFALYDLFRINDESDKYRLLLGSYNGTAGNSLDNNGYPFSTYDRDSDRSSYHNCAQEHRSAWWYSHLSNYYPSSRCFRWNDGFNRHCTITNLNGDYFGGIGRNIFWSYLPGNRCNIPQTEMKIRPI